MFNSFKKLVYAMIMLVISLLFITACTNGSRGVSNMQATTATKVETSNTPKPAEPSPTPVISASPSPTPTQIPTTPLDKPKTRKSFPILYYHKINDTIEGIEELHVSPGEFEKQMELLKKNNYTVITFDQLKDVQNIDNPVIITLDDGYEDNYTYAYPILKKYNFKATIFVTSDFIDKPSFLTTGQIKEMNGLINFQGHTVTHPSDPKPFVSLKNEEVEWEMSESKKFIESITGTKIDVFAYPVGSYDQRIINLTKKYYKYAVVNGGGLYTEGDSDYEIKRVYVPRSLDITGFEKKIKGGK